MQSCIQVVQLWIKCTISSNYTKGTVYVKYTIVNK